MRKTPTDELVLWADNTFTSTYQALRAWQSGNEHMLDEVVLGTEALYHIAQEIQRRHAHPFG